MQFLQTFAGLFANLGNLTWQMVVSHQHLDTLGMCQVHSRMGGDTVIDSDD